MLTDERMSGLAENQIIASVWRKFDPNARIGAQIRSGAPQRHSLKVGFTAVIDSLGRLGNSASIPGRSHLVVRTGVVIIVEPLPAPAPFDWNARLALCRLQIVGDSEDLPEKENRLI